MRKGKVTVNFLSFLLLTLFLVLSLFLVTVGVGVYRSERAKSSRTDESRVCIGYLMNKLRSGDMAGCVRVEERNGLKTLVIDDCEGYDTETLIYYCDGGIREMNKLTDSEIPPEYGAKLTSCKGFDFEISPDGFFRCSIEFDSGKTETLTYCFLTAQEVAS